MFKKVIYGILKKFKFLPPSFYVKIYYEYYVGKKLDLKNPIEFNQKLQWLKVYYKPPILTQLVDKYSVREYVADTVGEAYLNELIAVYDKVSDVDFAVLPEQYVMKAVHGYHFNIIVPEKAKLNTLKSKLLLTKWMHKNQYYRGGLEWAYKNVKPRIIVEKYLTQIGKESISDYKFFCFGGVPKFIQVDVDRTVGHARSYYNMEWKKMNLATDGIKPYEGEMERPKNYDEMLLVATKLAGDFPFVRVDLYNLDGKILFGEMTFYPTDGRMDFIPDHFNTTIGNYLTLPTIPKGQEYITEIQNS